MPSVDELIATLARSRNGIVTREELLLLGVTDDMIEFRVRNRFWTRLQAGVFLVGAAPPTWNQSLLGVCLTAPPFVRGSHRAAAYVHRFDGSTPGPLDVVTESEHRVRPRRAIVHQTSALDPIDCTVVDGIPVTSVTRTLIDYGAVVPLVMVERGVESMIKRGKTSEKALESRLADLGGRGRRGAGALRKVLGRRLDGGPAGSYLEVIAAHPGAANEPGLVRQHLVRFPDGEVVALDWAFPNERLDFEFDGDETHGTHRGSKRDLLRDKTLRRLGWTVRRFTYVDVKHRPAWVTSEILAMLAAARVRLNSRRFHG